eukprot:1160482-Pelagomonas_calceolata.AAC.2
MRATGMGNAGLPQRYSSHIFHTPHHNRAMGQGRMSTPVSKRQRLIGKDPQPLTASDWEGPV